jgi:hypothetical protein
VVNEVNTKQIKLNFGFFAYASFALVILKIAFGLDWSWGWVLAPVYLMMAPVGIGLAVLSLGIVALALIAFAVMLADILDRR